MARFAWLLLLLPTVLFAQPDTLWTRTFEGPGYAWHSVCVTADGEYIAVGEGGSERTFGYDLRIARLNSAGTALWDRVADMDQHEFGRVVLPMPDGGYTAAGSAHAYIDDWPYELFVARMNALGDTQWCHIYGGVDMWETYVMGMDTVPGGGYVLLSTTDAGDDFAPVLIRVAENGDSLWTRTYARAPWDYGVDVVSLRDGFAILGTCAGSWAGSGAYHLIRTNAEGDTLWTRIYSHPPEGIAQDPVCIARALGGGFILGGNIRLQDKSEIWIVRTDSVGDTLWTRGLSGPGSWKVGNIQPTNDGGFVVAGSDSLSWLLAKLDSRGNLLWTKSVGMGASEESALESVAQTSDGGFVAVGSRSSRPFAVGIAPDSVMAAFDAPGRTGAQSYALHECYPNPFNSATRLAFDLPAAGRVRVNVFDISGRRVRTLANENYSAGRHTLLFEGASLPTGIYFCQLRAGTYIETRKMILLR